MDINKILDDIAEKGKEKGISVTEDDLKILAKGFKKLLEDTELKTDRIINLLEKPEDQVGSHPVAAKMVDHVVGIMALIGSVTNEDILIHNIMTPLLLRMGCFGVKTVKHHGPGEFGKDMYFSQHSIFDRVEYTALVAKVKKIHASSSRHDGADVDTVINQVKAALTVPIYLVGQSSETFMNNCLVVTSKSFTEDANSILYNSFRNDSSLRGRISKLDGEDISQLCVKHSFMPFIPAP